MTLIWAKHTVGFPKLAPLFSSVGKGLLVLTLNKLPRKKMKNMGKSWLIWQPTTPQTFKYKYIAFFSCGFSLH